MNYLTTCHSELTHSLHDDEPATTSCLYWPEEGTRCQTYYSYWMLLHKLYVCFIVVGRISFERKPVIEMVYVEFYMDVVFFIDMIRCFTQPYMEGTRLITDRNKIVCRYVKSWFLFDVYGFFPLALIRYMSKWEEGGKNE